ncbi:MAG: hypothetical protein Q8P84_00275, partial [Deltaproteobacteria bacterium]|nr:hypothetical protein [Deltaproteobacteria bacterium]
QVQGPAPYFSKENGTLKIGVCDDTFHDQLEWEHCINDKARACVGAGATGFVKDTEFSEGTIEVKGAYTHGPGFGILFRAGENGNKGYSLNFDPGFHRNSSPELFPNGAYVLYSMDDTDPPSGKWVKYHLVAAAPFQEKMATGTAHDIRIEAVGSRISVYDDGRLVLAVDDETHKSGKIGVRSWNGGCNTIESLTVLEPNAPRSINLPPPPQQ